MISLTDKNRSNPARDHGTLSLEELKACVSHSIHIILQSLAYEDAKPYGRYLEEENGKV